MIKTDGRGFRLHSEVWVPRSRAEVFEVFADAFRLEELTPPWLNFEVLTPAPIKMREGVRIDYRLRLHGIPVWWKTDITQWMPPCRFQDSQLRGPYRRWIHTHTFLEQRGGTRIIDEVDYAVPGGRLIHWMFVRRDLQRIFRYRQQQLPRVLKVEAESCRSEPVTITRQMPRDRTPAYSRGSQS